MEDWGVVTFPEICTIIYIYNRNVKENLLEN